MKKLLFLVFITNLAFADTISKVAICPNISEDGNQLLSRVNSLKLQLESNSPVCKSLSQKLDQVSSILSKEEWATVKSLVKGNSVTSLEGEEINKLSVLTTDISSTLTEIVQSLNTNGQNCVSNKNKTSFLLGLSTVIGSASQVIGNVTGPYAIAINLGGQILAGAIKGIDQIIDKNTYNFRDDEKEKIFMNQFCAFSEIQKDINDYLNLDTRQEEINELQKFLKIKVKDLKENCQECNGIETAWVAREQADRIFYRMKSVVDVVSLGNDLNAQNFSRCHEIHRAFHSEDSDFSQLIKLLKNYQNPMSSKSDTEMIQKTVMMSEKLPGKFASLETCMLLPLEEKKEISHDFNLTMRDEILPLRDKIFSNQIQNLVQYSNRIYVSPLGDYMIKSLERQKWLQGETDRLYKRIHDDSNYSTTTMALIESMDTLKERIVQKILPRFLKHLEKEIISNNRHFKKELKRYNKIIEAKTEGDTKDPRYYISLKKEVILGLRLSLDKTQTALRYCDYSRYLLNSTMKIESRCEKMRQNLIEEFEALSEADKEVASIIKQRNVFAIKEDVSYQTSRIQEYKDHIKEWIERGDERWEKK